MKKLFSILIVGFLYNLFLFSSVLISAESSSQLLNQIIGEEYEEMSTMRYKLRELLERQKLNEVMQEANDTYSSFQNLEQWLEKLNSGLEGDELQQMLSMLESFEKHLRDVLAKQERIAEQFSSVAFQENTRNRIPLSHVMERLRNLIKGGKNREARELLNQMLALFDQQQRSLQESISNSSQEKYEQIENLLKKINEQVTQAIDQEKKVRSMLTNKEELSSNSKKGQINKRQQQITELTEKMKALLEETISSALVSLKSLETWIQMSEDTSRETEKLIRSNRKELANDSARVTQVNLQRIQQNITDIQEQTKNLSQSQRNRIGRRQRYLSDKGVRLPKFEYDYQVNPAYRKDIQQLNQEEHPYITPRQQKYLYDVIR